MSIPTSALDAGCRILAAAISRALENEANRADFAAWKAEQKTKSKETTKHDTV